MVSSVRFAILMHLLYQKCLINLKTTPDKQAALTHLLWLPQSAVDYYYYLFMDIHNSFFHYFIRIVNLVQFLWRSIKPEMKHNYRVNYEYGLTIGILTNLGLFLRALGMDGHSQCFRCDNGHLTPFDAKTLDQWSESRVAMDEAVSKYQYASSQSLSDHYYCTDLCHRSPSGRIGNAINYLLGAHSLWFIGSSSIAQNKNKCWGGL